MKKTNIKNTLITIAICEVVFGVIVTRPYAEQPTVTASWYEQKYRGNMCADSKTIFDERNPELAAHRSLPFGTRIKINITKNKFIICKIVDRGPLDKGRERDRRKAAFAK